MTINYIEKQGYYDGPSSLMRDLYKEWISFFERSEVVDQKVIMKHNGADWHCFHDDKTPNGVILVTFLKEDKQLKKGQSRLGLYFFYNLQVDNEQEIVEAKIGCLLREAKSKNLPIPLELKVLLQNIEPVH